MSLKNIVKGTSNRVLKELGALDKETETIGEQRLNVCKKCTTFSPSHSICDESKGGCGCYMKSKVLVEKASCPKNKW